MVEVLFNSREILIKKTINSGEEILSGSAASRTELHNLGTESPSLEINFK